MEEEKVDALIRIDFTEEEWKKRYTLKARVCMRIVSFLLPGFLKINLN